MNIIDRNFYDLVNEIKNLSEKEVYYRIRKSFDNVPHETQVSCMKFFNQFGYWGYLDPDRGVYEQIELKQRTLCGHLDDFVWVYRRLCDYRSKKTLYSILSNWYRYDFTSTAETREYLYDDYFDHDLVKCSENEVIVDLGAYTGDTVLSYIKNYGKDCYRKIYCYEITSESMEILKKNLSGLKNIEFRLKGVSDREGSLRLKSNPSSSSANLLEEGCPEGSESKEGAEGSPESSPAGGEMPSAAETSGDEIPVTTLDTDINEPVTLIKADIEGFEQKAILGAKNHIANDHPKLLISVYHGNEDLWKIPRMIYDINRDYKFYLRYKGSPIYPTEITLFAL